MQTEIENNERFTTFPNTSSGSAKQTTIRQVTKPKTEKRKREWPNFKRFRLHQPELWIVLWSVVRRIGVRRRRIRTRRARWRLTRGKQTRRRLTAAVTRFQNRVRPIFYIFGFGSHMYWFSSLRIFPYDSVTPSWEETRVEGGVVVTVEGGAARVEDVAPHRGDIRVVADDVAQVPRLWGVKPISNFFVTKS